MKAFRFKNFEIAQSEAVFRVGTDGVLLGAMATVAEVKSTLEVGCGTGLISLMLAQRNTEMNIVALDISPEAVELTNRNFEASPFGTRLEARLLDFNEFFSTERFDLIVSNPPYFSPNESLKDVVARQRLTLDFQSLIENSVRHLSASGILSVVIPFQFKSDFVNLSMQHGLFLIRNIAIQGISHGPVVRNVLEFSLTKKQVKEQSFVIESTARMYSEAYLELTKEFHVFSRSSNHSQKD